MGLLLPALDDDSRGFWEGCASGELRVQRCSNCERRRFPPRPMCPACQSLDHEWDAVSGRGTIWSFVIAHPPLLPDYRDLAPYNVIVVALDEDPTLRLVGNLVPDVDGEIGEIDGSTIEIGEIGEIDGSTIEIGEPVRVVFATIGDDPDLGPVRLPRWVRGHEGRPGAASTLPRRT